jgi:hypothetical protein
MFQSPRRAWAEGETVVLDGMSVRAEQIVEGSPSRLRFTFDHALEDPSYVFLTAQPIGIVRWLPPSLGEQVLLPRASEPQWSSPERYRDYIRIAPVPEMLHYRSQPAFVNFDPQR